MQTTWEQTHWLYNKPQHRQIIAFVVSVIIIVLTLMIPISLHYGFKQEDNVIKVVLSKQVTSLVPEQNSGIQQQANKPEIIKKPIAEPMVQKKPEALKPIKKIIKNPPIKVAPKIVEQPAKTPINEQPAKLPSSAVIFNAAYGKVHLYELDEDFKARTGHEDDFKFREIKQPEWNVVTKLIDEEVDKPRVVMDFYSEGILGSTERFFDKISYKKVFTTRYGTKIACGGVGPLVMCSWK